MADGTAIQCGRVGSCHSFLNACLYNVEMGIFVFDISDNAFKILKLTGGCLGIQLISQKSERENIVINYEL